jgi:hypothetical protein
MCFNLTSQVTFTRLSLARVMLNWSTRHSLLQLREVNPILIHNWLHQVLDCTQQPSVTGLEIQVVRHLSTMSCLQATGYDLRSKGHIYPYPLGITLDSRASGQSITFSERTLQFTCVPYQYLHTLWLGRQPTDMGHNDLHLMMLSSS